LCSLVPGLVALLWSDAKSTGRLRIKLSCDWQILSFLKSANARPGSETEDAIDLPAVVPFALQGLLHLLDVVPIDIVPIDIVPMPVHGHFFAFAEVGSRSGRRRAWAGDPRRQQYEDNPSPRGFAG
jgi:hypothetical protein